MPQNNLQEKLKTINFLKERLVHLRELAKKAKLLQKELLSEDITLSGTHVLEKLEAKINLTETHLYKAINDLLPRDLDCLPVNYAGSVDLIAGYVPLIKKNTSCCEAFVLSNGSVVSLETLEPEKEEAV